MKFSIVTASFRQPGWLKRCARSVADQEGVEVEHIIQDGGTEGIEGLRLPPLRPGYERRSSVEPDSGMYDALNRAFSKVRGDVVGILNCDEQYLPGTLSRVAAVFRDHPEADMVVGDYLIVDQGGQLLSYRRSTRLRPSMILSEMNLYDFTCAMFYRRRLLDRGIRFDPGYRAAADADWISRLLWSGVEIRYVREYFATFALTGSNVSQRAEPEAEIRRLRKITPRWAVALRPVLRAWRHCEKLVAGGYRSGPIEYGIYAGEEDPERTRFRCEKPEWRHPWA